MAHCGECKGAVKAEKARVVVRKNVLVHRCGQDGSNGGNCGCGFWITPVEAERMVREGRARYRFHPGAPGRVKTDWRAIVIAEEARKTKSKKVPEFPCARTISHRDIERAIVEKRAYDRERIKLFDPRNPKQVGVNHGFEEITYG